jgi:hypothetical protein
MSKNFIIPEDMEEYESKELILDSLNVLNLLKGKTVQEITNIFIVARKIVNYNAKL